MAIDTNAAEIIGRLIISALLSFGGVVFACIQLYRFSESATYLGLLYFCLSPWFPSVGSSIGNLYTKAKDAITAPKVTDPTSSMEMGPIKR